MSDVIHAIQYRVSNPRLIEPAPDRQHLDTLFRCAVRAPDHGRLRPWRFIVLEGQSLNDLGMAFESTQPEADEIQKQRLRAMPLRAPMIIVCVARLDQAHKKVPVWEQQVAAGVATQNIQLAASELGFGTMWRTGVLSDAAEVREHLNVLENEQIIAFLYMGTVDGEPRNAEFQDLSGIVEYRS